MEDSPKIVEKKKRGRKPKSEKINSENYKTNENNDNYEINENSENSENNKNINEIKVPKKRGRKPKGGKIVESNKIINNKINLESNVILHLKCNVNDSDTCSKKEEYDTYQFNENKYNELAYNYLSDDKIKYNKDIINLQDNENQSEKNLENTFENNNESMKNIWKKLDELTVNLHNNNISDKKSACFWCTYDFDNPPIFIPKYEFNGSYHVYGCFCSPECSTAYLMNENIDSTTKFERYHLLNFIYSKIYNYNRNIKPAPNPLYILDKYYGNLNIQEYRQLLKNERLLLVVEKPLTRMLPELHEDNDEFMLNTNNIQSSTKYKIRKNTKTSGKANILNDNFKLNAL